MNIDINEQEKELLAEVLETAHKSLLNEILHTDSYDYKELLKQKFELLKELQAKVAASLSNN